MDRLKSVRDWAWTIAGVLAVVWLLGLVLGIHPIDDEQSNAGTVLAPATPTLATPTAAPPTVEAQAYPTANEISAAKRRFAACMASAADVRAVLQTGTGGSIVAHQMNDGRLDGLHGDAIASVCLYGAWGWMPEFRNYTRSYGGW